MNRSTNRTIRRTFFLVSLGMAACAALERGRPGDLGALHGDYLEVRTATVFAGACHYASEREMLGREAVLAWRVRAGEYRGVDLAGLAAVAVVAADRNLEHDDAPRTAVLLVEASARPEQRDALAAWVRTFHGAALGRVAAVKEVPLTIAFSGDRFTVRAGGSVEIEGEALASRRCCNMPNEVWYEPLSPLTGRVVGSVSTFRQAEPALGRDFTYPADNCAFVGTF